jgi:hypothetical protein
MAYKFISNLTDVNEIFQELRFCCKKEGKIFEYLQSLVIRPYPLVLSIQVAFNKNSGQGRLKHKTGLGKCLGYIWKKGTIKVK